jgi:hypothetical protein
VPVVQQFEEVPTILRGEGIEAPVVDEQHVDAGEPGEQTEVGAVGAGQGEFRGRGERCGGRGPGSPCDRLAGRRRSRRRSCPCRWRRRSGDFGAPRPSGELADEGFVELACQASRELRRCGEAPRCCHRDCHSTAAATCNRPPLGAPGAKAPPSSNYRGTQVPRTIPRENCQSRGRGFKSRRARHSIKGFGDGSRGLSPRLSLSAVNFSPAT